MGYRNPELHYPLNLFTGGSESVAWSNEQLRRRLRIGNGQSIYRPDQVDAAYDELYDEPLLRLEYDRFLPEIHQRAAERQCSVAREPKLADGC
jgi:hypothetical protein